MSDRKVVVSGDIGGTNTRFSLVEVRRDRTITLLKREYRNNEFPSFLSVLERFLLEGKLDKPPTCGCFAVAGPVADNKVRFTNRDSWSIDGDEIAEQLNIPKVVLMNDFLAVGYGILTLDEEKECIVLQKAEKKPSAPIACIGAGTGLGECFLTPGADGHYNCFPSEGGHAEYAPRSDLEVELLQFLKHKFNQAHRVSVERVVSGTGLSNVYEFLAAKFPEKVDASLNAQIEAAGDMKGAVIAHHAGTDKLCELTMSTFATAYGSEAGVAALKWLPFGGLYLTGGLTPKNIEWIRHADGLFMKALLDKGRVSGMLNSIPIYAVMVEDLGERGAEYMGIKVAASMDTQSSVKSQPVSTKTVSPPAEPTTAPVILPPIINDSSSSTFTWLLVAGIVAAAAYTLGRRSH